jgi:MFS family permease
LISGAFSGLIAAGITGNMDYLHGLRAWRWLFIIEGTISVGIAIGAFFILPNFPRTTKWLTEEERQLATWRLEEDIGEDDWVDSEHQTFWKGFKMAFTDIKTYMLVCDLGPFDPILLNSAFPFPTLSLLTSP